MPCFGLEIAHTVGGTVHLTLLSLSITLLEPIILHCTDQPSQAIDRLLARLSSSPRQGLPGTTGMDSSSMQDARVIEVEEMGGETWGMLAVIHLSLLLRLGWQRRSFRLIAAAAFCL